jgi:predicted nucleotidyltransferase
LEDAAQATSDEALKVDIRSLARRAAEGRYNDYQSKCATPKMKLVHELKELGLEDLARRVVNGDFD